MIRTRRKYSGVVFLISVYSLTCLIVSLYHAIHVNNRWIFYLFMGLVVPILCAVIHGLTETLYRNSVPSADQAETIEIETSLAPRTLLEDTIDEEELSYLMEEFLREEGDHF